MPLSLQLVHRESLDAVPGGSRNVGGYCRDEKNNSTASADVWGTIQCSLALLETQSQHPLWSLRLKIGEHFMIEALAR